MNITLRSIIRVACVLSFFVGSAGLHAQTDSLVDHLKKHINYLASDKLAGRYPGTEGNKLAVDYVESTFKSYGLQPVNGSYRQAFDVPIDVKMEGENAASFNVIIPKPFVPDDQLKPITVGWKTGIDYTPLGFSDNAVVHGTMVFCGFGITDAHRGYDDFQGVDLKGKIAVILSGDPENLQPHERTKLRTAIRTRAIAARVHGAIAVVFVHMQGDSSDVLFPLQFNSAASTAGLVVINAKRSSMAKFFPKEHSLVDAEQALLKTKKPQSFEIPKTVMNISVHLKVEEATIENVIAMVPGTSRKDEVIIVGAHLDHLGYGDENSLYSGNDKRIHYGADDNASGTAGIMELAQMIAQHPLQRTVVFMAFNAEERGLLGSAYYAKNPIIPLEKTNCMINLDMIGRLKDDKVNIQGMGTSSRWHALIDSINTNYHFVISTTDDGFGPSDHSSFYAKERPVLFLFTGLHTDYHRPSDTPDKINYPGEARVVHFTEDCMRTIDSWNENPDFVKVKVQQSASAGFNVTFGVIPDYSDHPKGLHITGVREGTPAEKAGIQADDIIIKFGATTVKNIYDLTYAMGQSQPGDVVKVTVLRGPKEDKSVTMDVTLVGRK